MKRTDIEIDKIWQLSRNHFELGVMPISGKYDVTLPDRGAPIVVSKSISQSINSNEVDRFLINMGAQSDFPDCIIYSARLSIIYNENNMKLKSYNLLFVLPTNYDLADYLPL